ncbi:MAG TPA: DUF4494 domain-containing protein [Prolixibacteraceae bacterium]|nr:DUF4494 domain-containing protein [Prolixibacteraceae bacterium]HPS13395.1 DUF4494 domain-containing protein [Prolixibacteraceae bacterium]
MQTWYECKVKYLKIDQGGFERKINDSYLVDAVSFTDAETRIFQIMKEITNGDFQVVNIKRSNVNEVLSKMDGEWWYKAKINLVTIDEEAGKEKKVTNYVLVMANDINDALKQLEDGLSYMLIPYVTTLIQLSNIAEVFPYVPGEHVKPTPVARPVEEEPEEEEVIEEEEIESFEEEEEEESEPEE